MRGDFDKQFFQTAWGEEGYLESFSYGVGIESVCEVGLLPFFSPHKDALEIGPGGGTFTSRMVGNFNHLTVMDVIRRPLAFKDFDNFTYIELSDRNFDCPVPAYSIDFAFSYNVFCHLSNDALSKYLKGINKALKFGGDFVFMLSNYRHTSKIDGDRYSLGDLMPVGHFCQDLRTLDLIIDDNWEVVNNNLLPDHRDIVIHLRKI
jgi:SAM-dependent methyltransferase